MTEGVMVRYITTLSPQGTFIHFMDSFILKKRVREKIQTQVEEDKC